MKLFHAILLVRTEIELIEGWTVRAFVHHQEEQVVIRKARAMRRPRAEAIIAMPRRDKTVALLG